MKTLIRQALDCYPTLFQSRERILDHLYCVIGNGFSWQTDGTIGEGTSAERSVKRTLRQAIAENVDHDDGKLVKFMYDTDVEFNGCKETFVQYRKRCINDRAKEIYRAPKPTSYYPLSDRSPRYALVQNVPDNVQQDYLDAAFEVLALILACDPEIATCGYSNSRNQMIARKILKGLEKRFPGRKAHTGTVQRVAVPRRCESCFYLSEESLLEYEIGDRVTLTFGGGYRVAKKYAGRSVRFVVNNVLDHSWGRKMRRLALIPEGGTDRDVLILEESYRFECLMKDLFPVNRKPYAGWNNKKVTITKD